MLPSAELVHDSTTEANNPDAGNQAAATQAQRFVEVRYRVEGINIEGSNVLLSDVFNKLATMLAQGTIKDFQLTRTNLEQVFINFAKF